MITSVSREQLNRYVDFECATVLQGGSILEIDDRYHAHMFSNDDREFWVEMIDAETDEDVVSLQCVGTFPGNRTAAALSAVRNFILPAIQD